MAWPTKTFDIPGYDGWNVTYMDLSVEEVRQFSESVTEGSALDALHMILPAIKNWTLTDRDDNPIPATAEGLAKVPMPVVMAIYQEVLGALNEPALPKETTTSES